MISLENFPNVEAYLDRNDFMFELYGSTIISVINDAYVHLTTKTMMPEYIKCDDNDDRTLYDMFKKLISDYMLEYADGSNMATYNVMTETSTNLTEDVCFYDLWRKYL